MSLINEPEERVCLGIISCSLCSTRHDYRRPFARPATDHVQSASLHQPAEAATLTLRADGAALQRPHPNLIPRVFRTGLLGPYSSRQMITQFGRINVLQGVVGEVCLQFALDRRQDNEPDPTDTDSRTSFPDKSSQSIRKQRRWATARTSGQRPPITPPVQSPDRAAIDTCPTLL
jgi:hypothetical protein